MKLRLAFEAPGKNPVSRMIAGFDAPRRFSHVALIFGDCLRLDAHVDYGVRFHGDVPNPERWTFIDLPLFDGEIETVRQFCEIECGAGYDPCGVLAIAHVPLMKEQPGRWFCSELAAAALQQVDLFEGLTPHLLSPNGLYVACQRANLVSDN